MARPHVPNSFRWLGAFVWGLAALGLPSRAAADTTWLKVETKDVCVYSDASRHDVTEFVVQYSAFRSVFNQIFAPPGTPAPPAKILLFRKSDTLKDYVLSSRIKVENLTEYSTQVGTGHLFALAVAGRLLSSARDDPGGGRGAFQPVDARGKMRVRGRLGPIPAALG